MQINEEIKESDLHIEDADSDIIFDSELIDFDKEVDFLFGVIKFYFPEQNRRNI